MAGRCIHVNVAGDCSVMAEVRRLRAEIASVKALHNGYDPKARKVMPKLREPESLAGAVRSLMDEAYDMGRTEAEIKCKKKA